VYNLKSFLFLGILSLLAFRSMGQGFYDWKLQRDWIISINGGTASYFGELNPDTEINFSPSAVSVGIQRNIWNRIDGKAEIGAYYVRVIDERRRDQGDEDFRFSGTSFEIVVSAVVNLFDESNSRYYERRLFQPYLLIGTGATFMNNKIGAGEGSERIPLRDLDIPEEDSYSPIAGFIYAGAGFKFKINYLMNVGFEGAYRYLTTDYFDNHKNRGTNSNAIFNNDMYWIMAFRFETYLPPDIFRSKKSSKYGKVKWFRKLKKEAYWQN
jgi:hypothetical protein